MFILKVSIKHVYPWQVIVQPQLHYFVIHIILCVKWERCPYVSSEFLRFGCDKRKISRFAAVLHHDWAGSEEG